jgi:hypothetical protein
MKKNIVYQLFCLLIASSFSLDAQVQNNEEQHKKQIVVQLDMPHHETVPSFMIYYAGHMNSSDETGMAHFIAPKILPQKWYFLFTKQYKPMLQEQNSIKSFSIDPKKAYRCFSCSWNETEEQWNIKKKNLQKNKYILKHPENCIIINLNPDYYLNSIKQPHHLENPQEQTTIMLPRIILKTDGKKQNIKRASIKSQIYNQEDARLFHRRLKKTITEKTDDKTAVRIELLQAS